MLCSAADDVRLEQGIECKRCNPTVFPVWRVLRNEHQSEPRQVRRKLVWVLERQSPRPFTNDAQDASNQLKHDAVTETQSPLISSDLLCPFPDLQCDASFYCRNMVETQYTANNMKSLCNSRAGWLIICQHNSSMSMGGHRDKFENSTIHHTIIMKTSMNTTAAIKHSKCCCSTLLRNSEKSLRRDAGWLTARMVVCSLTYRPCLKMTCGQFMSVCV